MTGVVLMGWSLAVAVVAASVLAKLVDWTATRAAWPVRSRRWRWLLGPGQVVSGEVVVVALTLLPLPGRSRLLVLAALYVGYAVAGLVLRGRPCACFGTTLATRFGWRHAALCAAVAALLGAGAFASPSTVDASVAAAAGIVVGVVAMSGVYLRRRVARQRITDPAKLALVDHVVVYGSTGCPGCRGVWAQRDQLAALASCDVAFELVSEKEAMARAGGAIPAAIGYDRHGDRVFGPAVGLAAIRAMFTGTTREMAPR
ncbi:hypothetical protein [Actinophytocola oryzae]|uniref:Uncharacterized protein n=1 Tax=Actinophytocola oryzae TaxID=502181 RepID=A0A4R7VL67_9PSEU|nr:hypothetical protein [Actinophytocola oryzae]TDV49949.1 hypothetical protein CLV71_107297 [Actinophytocola oryzae]